MQRAVDEIVRALHFVFPSPWQWTATEQFLVWRQAVSGPKLGAKRGPMIATQDLRAEVLQAAELVKHDRQAGLAQLNKLFAQGTAPSPALDGRYQGALLTTSVNPVLDGLTKTLFGWWMPWKGKTLNPAQQSGDNIFTNDGLWLAKIVFAGYQGYVVDEPGRSRALTFRTYLGEGKDDPGLQVLKIDYDLDVNPKFVVRDVLDELVQMSNGYYLGKALLHWRGRWRCAAFFTLQNK